MSTDVCAVALYLSLVAGSFLAFCFLCVVCTGLLNFEHITTAAVCRRCRYDLAGLSPGSSCPECNGRRRLALTTRLWEPRSAIGLASLALLLASPLVSGAAMIIDLGLQPFFRPSRVVVDWPFLSTEPTDDGAKAFIIISLLLIPLAAAAMYREGVRFGVHRCVAGWLTMLAFWIAGAVSQRLYSHPPIIHPWMPNGHVSEWCFLSLPAAWYVGTLIALAKAKPVAPRLTRAHPASAIVLSPCPGSPSSSPSSPSPSSPSGLTSATASTAVSGSSAASGG